MALPEFTPRPLTAADRAHFRAQATHAMSLLVQSIKLVAKGNVVVIDRVGDRGQPKSTLTQARVSMPGALDDVSAFYLGTLDKPEQYCNQMRYDSTKPIYNLVPRTPNHPNRYMGLRWNAYATPVLCRPRDLFVLEYFDEFVDDQGRRGWARCIQSVEHSSCPSVPGYVRATARTSGFVALESVVPGVVDFFVILDVDFGGHLSSWVRKMILAKQMRTIHLLEEHLSSIVQDSPALRYFRECRKLSEPQPRITSLKTIMKQRYSTTMSEPAGPEERSFGSAQSSWSLRQAKEMDWNLAMPAECFVCRTLLRAGAPTTCATCKKTACAECCRPNSEPRQCLVCAEKNDDGRPLRRMTPQHAQVYTRSSTSSVSQQCTTPGRVPTRGHRRDPIDLSYLNRL
ncbi:hypothetical protein SDRG_10791 [Saprolegnia diclina VS20]|uniref:START domain-containing protein n=1 Tax=Saprolegnia diclina (strain VS20) TaxID=1156394 RepID=T0QDH8_SAPDV|nr:hypothetical protein SDRG_10791 [Saprolegnia diclina VS20]EQC31625.1 hypothetical protein SDRG_10791 [Saprolegnia diclina VS20]|eukprot:XP_008615024.1 hypothetical protein SDRG_10791 [Saprolegnia diclina VS20]